MEGLEPARLLLDFQDLFSHEGAGGLVLDLACGDGHNGIFLARKGFRVVLADRSEEALEKARALASEVHASVSFWQVDFEEGGVNPLQDKLYDAILVFRYLHRPLVPRIRDALRGGGILIYETYMLGQEKFGKPHNPDHLLKPGELQAWFGDWNVLHYFEGIVRNPDRVIAQIVCRKTE